MQNDIKAHLSHHGCYGGVVTARYEHNDEAVSFVAYSTAASDFVITQFGVSPQATTKEAQLAGDLINSLLETEAHKLGIRRLLIVLPDQDTAKVIEEYKVQSFVTGLGVKANTSVYVN
jgi:hypothetical protein